MARPVFDNSTPMSAEKRRKLLAKVHVGRKALGIGEDDYRALLERLTGHRSATYLDHDQLDGVLGEFERLGFHSSTGPTSSRTTASHPVANKARAMWISLYQIGAIDDPTEAALESFSRRQLGVDRLQWANQSEGSRLIEALKSIAARYGLDQRLSSRMSSAERVRVLKDRLVGAQLARLVAAGLPVAGPLADDRSDWSNKRLESAAAKLASLIHSIPKPP